MLHQAKNEILARLANWGVLFGTVDPATNAMRESRAFTLPAFLAEIIASLVIVRFIEILITHLIKAGLPGSASARKAAGQLQMMFRRMAKQKDSQLATFDLGAVESVVRGVDLQTMVIDARTLDAVMDNARSEIETLLRRRAEMPASASERLSWELVSIMYECYAAVSLPPSRNAKGADIVIVTALDEEREAVLAALSTCERVDPSPSDVRVYFRSELRPSLPSGRTGLYVVVVMSLGGMGRVGAVAATADAIRRWQPRYVLMLGIAGGIAEKGVAVGDVVIADQVVDYELQKLREHGSEIRWQVHQVDPRLLMAARHLVSDRWSTELERPETGRPRRHFGPIFSGDKVVADSNVLRQYRKHWPAAIAVEMEGAGVAVAAAQAAGRPPFFMIRGVSDLADQEKDTAAVDRWRPYACKVSAAFTVGLLQTGPIISASVTTNS